MEELSYNPTSFKDYVLMCNENDMDLSLTIVFFCNNFTYCLLYIGLFDTIFFEIEKNKKSWFIKLCNIFDRKKYKKLEKMFFFEFGY